MDLRSEIIKRDEEIANLKREVAVLKKREARSAEGLKSLYAQMAGGYPILGGILLRLNEYQAINLKTAIAACESGDSPLSVLCTGDWIGEIRNMLDAFKTDYLPNQSVEQLQQAAKRTH